MSFDKHSNFNKLANFSEVKFGENMPVLEVELNEMQQIQNEARADIIRDTMPSGFVTLGEIDYDHCASKDNQLKLKTESIAYVNGYRITIPANTIIEIGESDKVREDLVFLEVWKEVVTDIDELKEYGGEDNEVINNPIKDSRYPVSTTQRVALKYRIRHVGDVDFSGDTSGLSSLSYDFHSSDKGLYIKTFSESLDGFVYAIPMFRLLRKPNVGLASPFEYKKIHNQLDPKKFAHLVGQENVEKVHSVDIKGKTYRNLITHAKTQWSGTSNVVITPDLVTFSSPSSWGKVGFLVNGEPNTKYIFHCSDFYKTDKQWVQFYVRFYNSIHGSVGSIYEVDSNTYTFTTDSTGQFVFTFETPSGVTGAYVKNPIIMRFSEWDEQLRGHLVSGLESLGESTNNSITVENNLVDEGTYVHELQNHIFPTYPEVTHVTWGEDVVIPPEVEIELKNGEEVIQTITQLPVKLETTGEEKLHVKTMKGQTLINVDSCYTDNDFISFKNATINSDGWITITANGDFLNAYSRMNNLIKPNTKYLAIIEIKENTLNGNFVPFSMWGEDTCFTTNFLDMNNNNSWVIDENAKGVFKSFLTTKDDIASAFVLERSYVDVACTTGSITYRVMLIEYQEGMENWDISFFRGMKSVEAPNIKVTGKNLFNVNLHKSLTVNNDGKYVANSSDWSKSNVDYKLKPNTEYTISLTSSHSHCWICLLINGQSTSVKIEDFSKTFTTDSTGVTSVGLYADTSSNIGVTLDSIQLEESSTRSNHVPYQSNLFKTPKETVLRRLPNGVCSTLNFSTGDYIQRIGEVTFDGSDDENWSINNIEGTTTNRFITRSLQNSNVDQSTGVGQFLCDKLKTEVWNQTSRLGLTINRQDVYIYNASIDYSASAIKQWLSQYPITVQYELAKPITKIGLSEEDYVGKSKVTYQLAEPLRRVGNYSDYIQGNTLYSNIGVEVLDGSENWEAQNNTGNNHGFFLPHTKSIYKSPLISPQLPTLDGWEDYTRKGIFRGTKAIGLVVSADDLSENTLQGFKNWLRDNPVTIYYVKSNPSEIPLKEVSPLECDFSLYRQFNKEYLGYPKELPNGVKDIVVSKNKIKRYTRHLIFNGSDESWTLVSNSSSGSVVRAFTNVSNNESLRLKALSEILNSYKFPFGTASDVHEQIGVDQNGNVVLSLAKSRLSSSDLNGFKDYLRRKNLQVIVELNTPTMHDVSEGICKHIPYMPLNSYVGSLYLTNGINQTKFLTDFSPSEYEVQTYHRHFSSDFNMFEDIKRKKSPYGHETYLEEIDGKYVEKFISGLEKHEIEDLRHKVSLTGFDYSQLLQDSFLKLIKGELS